MLVPITVYQPKGQEKYSILDGERRYRCVVELNSESDKTGKTYDLPANVVQAPSKIAGLLYMFSIHNFRESWELMPTALGLRVVMDELGEKDTKRLSRLQDGPKYRLNDARSYWRFPKIPKTFVGPRSENPHSFEFLD